MVRLIKSFETVLGPTLVESVQPDSEFQSSRSWLGMVTLENEHALVRIPSVVTVVAYAYIQDGIEFIQEKIRRDE